MIHPRKMRWLFFVKSIFAVIAAFALLGWAVNTAGGSGPVFSQESKLTGYTKSWAWVAGINIAISGKTTLAMNMPDLTRYARNPSDTWWQLLFIPVVYFTFSFIGIVVASAGQAIYGTLYWDPTQIINLWDNRAGAFFCAFAFALATLGTNISTNSIASSNDFAFLAPKYLNIKRGAFLTAVLGGWATCPWQIQASATSLTTFLSGYVIVLAPIVAIMVSYLSAEQPRWQSVDCRLLGYSTYPSPRAHALPERGCFDTYHRRPYQLAWTDQGYQREHWHWKPILLL